MSQPAPLNPLAVELNGIIEKEAPVVMRVLSELGKKLYFPKGILTQSAEAKEKGHRYNATIGEARELKHSMGLPSITCKLTDITPDQALPYAPSAGRVDLRKAWLKEISEKNPSLGDLPISLPVVTSGITHGLRTVADMFVDEGDLLLLPDQVWGNYNLIFNVKRGAKIGKYSLYSPNGGFDLDGLRETLEKQAGLKKLMILFNFPNNPTGYSITAAEADGIRDILARLRREARLRPRGRLRRRVLRALLRRGRAQGVALHAAGRPLAAHPRREARRRLQRGLRLGPARGLHHLCGEGRRRRLRGPREEDRRLHPRHHQQLAQPVAVVWCCRPWPIPSTRRRRPRSTPSSPRGRRWPARCSPSRGSPRSGPCTRSTRATSSA